MIRKLQDAVRHGEPGMLQRLRALVEIESPSGDAAAVRHAANLVADWARELGGAIVEHDGGVFGPVLEVRFAQAAGAVEKPVLLLGHLDTVWPQGTLAHMPWREADGKIFGPGVLDMKVGVVMALAAVAAVQAVRGALPRPVVLLLNPDEEVGSPVSRAHTERLAREAAAVFVLEPAQGLAYKTARKGVGHWELVVEGVGAHAGVDFAAGRSAVRAMARLIEEVSGWTDEARGVTVNVGVVTGGTRANVIAAECRAEVDGRVVTRAEAAALEARFDALRLPEPYRLRVTGGINRPPMERAAGTLRLFEQARLLAAELGLALEEAATGGGSDGNFTAALGVPTLDGMGAVGAGAHAAHEHIVRAHLVERTTLLAAML